MNFLQNGCRRPFWMSEDHFGTLAILDQYRFFFFFYKMAAGCPKIIFDLISGHFRSIRNFFFLEILTKWLTSDVRNSLWITFLAILENSKISKIHFQSQFWPFQIDTEFFCRQPFWMTGCPQITFDRISGHFRSIRNFCFEFV